MKARPIYALIASAVQARKNCEASGNTAWHGRWTDRLESMQDELPSGSGFDCGSKIDIDRCRPDRIVLTTSFHHMHESGMYDGWTEHDVIVTPAFDGINIRVTGRDRNGIKEYIGDLFHEVLTQEIEPVTEVQ